jgi:Spy/CpxP family protein refolding chaperone
MPGCASCGSLWPAPIAKRVGRLALRQAPGMLALQPMHHQWSQGWGGASSARRDRQGKDGAAGGQQQRQRLADDPDDQAAAVADDPAGQVDQGKA